MLQQRLARSLQSLAKQSPLSQIVRQSATPSRASTSFITPIAIHPIQTQRWYSSAGESEAKKEETLKDQAEAQGAQDATKETAKEDAVQKELEAKKKEVIELTDRMKRSIADYRNLQEQTKREVQAARDFALQKFAKDLLDSVDNLDRAITTVPADKLNDQNPDLVNLHGGLKMTEELLLRTLSKHGLERFDPSAENDVFDSKKHDATFQAPMPDKKDGTVFFTQSKGFMYNGRVIRAAKVGVVKNS